MRELNSLPGSPVGELMLVYTTTIPLSMRSFLRGQLAFMKKHGFHVVGVSSPQDMLRQIAEREGIPVYGVPMRRGISPLSDLLALLRFVMLFLKLRPTIVNASTPKAGLLGMIAAAVTLVPVRVLVLRGLLTDREAGRKRIFLKAAGWISCSCAHQVIAVSKSVAQGTIKDRLCSPEKIRVLGKGSSNGVDAAQRFNPARIDNTQIRALRSKYGIPVDSPVIGFVGRIARDKGIAELAQAWSLIRRRWENARLLVIGAVETEAPVSGPVLDLLKSDPRVLMTGHVDPHNLPVHYSLMRVLVMPSYREGFPNVLLEASAMELPIVATRVTGCVDAVIDGVTGILVSVRDCQAFAHAIERYLRDPNLAQGHGRAGRKRVLEEFQPESIWRLLLDEYLRLLREKRIAFLEPRSDEMASNDHTGA